MQSMQRQREIRIEHGLKQLLKVTQLREDGRGKTAPPQYAQDKLSLLWMVIVCETPVAGSCPY
jgi:hypothetical protein